MIATSPSKNRFESNPHLFFGLFPNEDHKILIAGGLWQPTSQQARLVREAISKDAKPFRKLFSDKQFRSCFETGFHMEDVSSRTPRGFSEEHKDIAWIKLKKFVVYKVISQKDFSSTKFEDAVIKDLKQALRLNQLLDHALKMRWPPC